MSAFYKSCIKPLFFKLDPESAHELAVELMRVLSATPVLRDGMAWANQLSSEAEPVNLFGLDFPNRVGLAAGFDKNAVCWRAFESLGFGHVEIGTVTYKAQPGNPKPRMFRYPPEETLLNRMGFNNEGAEAVAKRLSKLKGPGERGIPLGINIGKSKVAPIDEAVEDYLGSFDLLADLADYLVINVSSPNTPNLRQLQEGDRLRELLAALQERNVSRSQAKNTKKLPILLKIAPDLTEGAIDDILEILFDLDYAGIIATNTTMDRSGRFENINQAGGLSGKVVEKMSTEVVRYISKKTEGKLPIIGVGGIDSSETALRKLDAGASLVQVYSGMIYQGPFLAKKIARSLAAAAGDY